MTTWQDSDDASAGGEAAGAAVQSGVTARRESLTDQLIRQLTARIEDGSYPRGQRLPSEQALIDEFGVSRTVVREAVANLRASGELFAVRGIGVYVAERQPGPSAYAIKPESLLAAQSLLYVLELRIAIESEAASLAALRRTDAQIDAMRAHVAEILRLIDAGEDPFEADMAFHRTLAEATHNPEFINLFSYIGGLLLPRTRLRVRQFEGHELAEFRQRMEAEHTQICHALERRDADLARVILRSHLSNSRDRLRQGIQASDA